MLTAAMLLASRMAIVAAIVVSVSVVVARSGPVVGAMLAAMPISAGPSYVFLALDYPADFVARSAISSLLAACATSAFVVAHGLAVRAGGQTLVSLVVALGAFLVAVMMVNLFTWTLPAAAAIGTLAMILAIVATRRARREAVPFALPPRRIDLVVRALAVMTVVATVTILAALFGARAAGYGALIPVVFTSFVIVVQPRVGGAAIAGLFAHALFGILAFVPAFTIVHLTAEPLGVWWALLLGLLICAVWNVSIVLLRRRGLLPE